MIEYIKHLLGFCHDHHSHIDLKDILLGGAASTAGISYAWWSVRVWIKNRRSND